MSELNLSLTNMTTSIENMYNLINKKSITNILKYNSIDDIIISDITYCDINNIYRDNLNLNILRYLNELHDEVINDYSFFYFNTSPAIPRTYNCEVNVKFLFLKNTITNNKITNTCNKISQLNYILTNIKYDKYNFILNYTDMKNSNSSLILNYNNQNKIIYLNKVTQTIEPVSINELT